MMPIICIDDNNGMMFNNRRQSRDAAVVEKITELSKGSILWMNSYSKKLFADSDNICVSDTFLSECKENEFAFVENSALLPFEANITKLIVFRWNRDYPFDVTLDINLDALKLTSSEKFAGNSHEEITMEVYVK